MINKETFYGYSIFLVVCLLLLAVLSQINISPWLHFISPALAILASLKFVHKMSTVVIGLLVVFLTAVSPILILIMIGSGSEEPLMKYVNSLFLFQLLLPTIVTVICMVTLKKTLH